MLFFVDIFDVHSNFGGEKDFFWNHPTWQSLFDFDGMVKVHGKPANRPQKLGDPSTFTWCVYRNLNIARIYICPVVLKLKDASWSCFKKTAQGPSPPPLKMSVIYVRFYQGFLAPESHEWADNLHAAAGCHKFLNPKMAT